MKAGLVTFYHIHHYGALLQAAATERAVERFGWDCEIIDYFVNQDNALFKRPTGLGSAAHDAHTALHYQALSERYRRFEKFSRDHLRISDRRYGRFDELAGGPLPYDLILSGSDQIWNPKIFPDGRFDPVFFGTFSQKRRIAYAPSFGVPTIPEGMQAELKGYLDGFSHLSARETQGSAIIRDIAGKDAPVVLDPTLLLTAEDYRPLFIPGIAPAETIHCYLFRAGSAVRREIGRTAAARGLEIVRMTDRTNESEGKMPGIGQWLSALHDARYVVTDSFHACAFCILFHKPFAVYINRRRGSARIRSLLEQFGLEGRIASPGKPLAQTLDAPIDWEAVERTLEERRADSRGFLALHLQEAPPLSAAAGE